jgi:hypothetical protein
VLRESPVLRSHPEVLELCRRYTLCEIYYRSRRFSRLSGKIQRIAAQIQVGVPGVDPVLYSECELRSSAKWRLRLSGKSEIQSHARHLSEVQQWLQRRIEASRSESSGMGATVGGHDAIFELKNVIPYQYLVVIMWFPPAPCGDKF